MHFKVAVRSLHTQQAGDSISDVLRVVSVLWLSSISHYELPSPIASLPNQGNNPVVKTTNLFLQWAPLQLHFKR